MNQADPSLQPTQKMSTPLECKMMEKSVRRRDLTKDSSINARKIMGALDFK
jgi:hypothetical protein